MDCRLNTDRFKWIDLDVLLQRPSLPWSDIVCALPTDGPPRKIDRQKGRFLSNVSPLLLPIFRGEAMMTRAVAALCLLALCKANDADMYGGTETDWDAKTDVEKLDERNFATTIKSGLWLVEFYAPWCGHCKSLKPHFDKAATSLKASGKLRLGSVDATISPGLAEENGVGGFPTLLLFKNGEYREKYNG